MSADEKLAAFVAGMSKRDGSALVAGLYLVGSHALADVRPDSDVDFLGVLHRLPEGAELSTLAALHDRLQASWPAPHLDGHYVLATDLRRPPGDVEPVLRYLLGERVESAPGAVTPVEWLTLKWRGVALMGVPADNLHVNADVEALRSYCRRNLVEYWRPQIERLAELAEVDELVAWVGRQVSWIALGVPRLLASIETGEVLSKTEAGRYALAQFPEWRSVLEASLEQRRAPRPEQIPVLAAMAPQVVAFGRRCLKVALPNDRAERLECLGG